MVRVSVNEEVDDDVNDADEGADGCRRCSSEPPRKLEDETSAIEVESDAHATNFLRSTTIVHRHCPHNYCRSSLSSLSSSCNDDFGTKSSLESTTNLGSEPTDRGLVRSNSDFYRNVSLIPSLAVD